MKVRILTVYWTGATITYLVASAAGIIQVLGHNATAQELAPPGVGIGVALLAGWCLLLATRRTP
jgi:hypothetical protein